jgi:hypothetical protein
MGIWKFLDAATDDIRLGDIYSNTLHTATLMSSLNVTIIWKLAFLLAKYKRKTILCQETTISSTLLICRILYVNSCILDNYRYPGVAKISGLITKAARLKRIQARNNHAPPGNRTVHKDFKPQTEVPQTRLNRTGFPGQDLNYGCKTTVPSF